MGGQNQSGATMWSTVTIVLMVGLIVYVFGKMILVFIDHGIIRGSMQEIVNQQGFNEMTANQINVSIQKRMRVDNIRGFGRESFKVSREKSGQKYIVIDYDKKIHLFGNISALVEFDEEIKRERR